MWSAYWDSSVQWGWPGISLVTDCGVTISSKVWWALYCFAYWMEEMKYMLDNKIAVPSCSSWASPCLLVEKLASHHCCCIDFHKVNSVTKPDSYPLLQNCKFDLLKRYWQVPLTPRAQEISAFVTPSGLFSYTFMGFGLHNAPATYQRLMNRVVNGLAGCAVYLDDVILHSDTWEEHMARIRALFDCLADGNLTVTYLT